LTQVPFFAILNLHSFICLEHILFLLLFNFMAHKKAGGSTTLGRDSISKRLGVKLTNGEFAKNGSIIIRQRGTKYHPGKNVKRGNDDTLFATVAGVVKFATKKLRKYNNQLKDTKIVSVLAQK